jgi:hypothetical protein
MSRLKVCFCLDYIEYGLQEATTYRSANSEAAAHQHHRSPNIENRQLGERKGRNLRDFIAWARRELRSHASLLGSCGLSAKK